MEHKSKQLPAAAELRLQIQALMGSLPDLANPLNMEAARPILLQVAALRRQEKAAAALQRKETSKGMEGAKRQARGSGKARKLYVITCQATPKKYPGDRSARWVKFRCSDLYQLAKFLDKKFPAWCFFNVFANVGPEKGKQLAAFTKNKRPKTRKL